MNIDSPQDEKNSFDLIGLGKVAKAIPQEVYKQTAKTALKTFEALVAPLTQTTDGVGRLIRQTFDNWVEVRKAVGAYTLQQAVMVAKTRLEKEGKSPLPANHPKSFLRALEEASLETDFVMHEMWVNLLASQMVDGDSRPRFVNILAQLGPEEARLLTSLKPVPKDPRITHFFGGSTAHSGMSAHWITALDESGRPWNMSVTLICQQSLADVSPLVQANPGEKKPVLLHLTPFGKEFMDKVATPK